ncbi:hypothetical protein [Kribbella sp. CA-294648]|uniref:hypothetical protein n=1 Tax=Kribbella sp. CA-294648 TaxID=3239948 RepID=UPI003D913607
MAARVLQEMGLDDKQVASAAGFLELYAETTVAELEALPLIEPDSTAIDAGPPLAKDPAFTLAADAASAFREAAQWMLYLDPAHAGQLLARSGYLFHSMGLPYGMYLLVVAGNWIDDPPFDAFAQAIKNVRQTVEGNRIGDASPFLQYPQQQAYLLLASGGSPLIGGEFRRDLTAILESSPHRDGTVAVGAMGTPIRRLWDIALHLVMAGDDAHGQIRLHFTAMCGRYAETMALAQSNQYLWEGAAAPVDVGDMDLTGIAALTARRLGTETLYEIIQELQELPEFGPIAVAPLRAGLALVDPARARIDGEW